MPIIKPRGLLRGDRMAELSDEARLYWPFFYAGSNGYGRFALDYRRIVDRCFGQFQNKPSREVVIRLLNEYRDKSLLFVYQAPNGQRWAAWDSAAAQSFYTAEDNHSPAPPEAEFSDWKRSYRERKESGRHRDDLDIDTKNGEICASPISDLGDTNANRTSESISESQHPNIKHQETSSRARVHESPAPKERSPREPAPDVAAEKTLFDQVYDAYPPEGRTNRRGSFDAWLRALSRNPLKTPEVVFAEMMAGLDRWRASDKWRRGKIHNFANWIDQDLWTESPVAAVVAITRYQPTSAASLRDIENEKGIQRAIREAMNG